MADVIETVMKHPSGKHQPVLVYGAARRDALLARGYVLVERGNPLPKAPSGQKRRTSKPPKE